MNYFQPKFFVGQINNNLLSLYGTVSKNKLLSISIPLSRLDLLKTYKLKKETRYIYLIDLTQEKAAYISDYFKDVETFKFKNKVYLLNIKALNITVKNYNQILEPSVELQHSYNLLYNVILLLYKQFNININTKKILSLSGISYQIFKQYKLQYNLITKVINSTEDRFIRNSYIGGRNEIFTYIYDSEAYYYDINSMYAFIMQKSPMPVGRPTKHNTTYFINNFDINDYFGFLEVDIISPLNNINIPVLPVRLPNTGIIYPVGHLKNKVYFSEELKLALKKGYIIQKIHMGYSFNKEIIFNDFVSVLYSYRQAQSDKKLSNLFKNLTNSLYGRLSCIFQIENNCEIVEKRFNIAISSAISSYARIHLYTSMENYSDSLLYWDTDAVFLTKPLLNEEIDQTKLGSYKHVDTLKSVIFFSTKFYAYQNILNEYSFKFRGLKANDYKLNYNHIYSLGYQQLVTSCNKMEYIISFQFFNIKRNQLEILQQIFNTKRKAKFQRKALKKDLLHTQPYIYSNQYIK